MSDVTDFYPLYHFQYRVILIGDSTVGKSSLLLYFTESRSASISDPTVGMDFYSRIVELTPDLRVKLNIWDSAGQERFKSLTRSYYRNTAGVIIVYDITSRSSFDNIKDWLNEAEMNIGGPNPSECVFLIVGHKSDLEAKREVLYEEGEYFAKYHKIKFIETSAVSGENEAFLMVAREINSRLENGKLPMTDGWEGIKKGFMRSQSISLSEFSRDPMEQSNCSC